MAIDHFWAVYRNAAKAPYIGSFYRCVFKNVAIGVFFFLAKSVIPTQNNCQHSTDATNYNQQNNCRHSTDATNYNQQNNCQHSTVLNQLPINKTSSLPKDCIAQIIYRLTMSLDTPTCIIQINHVTWQHAH